MSGFAGVWHLDGRPGAADELTKVIATIAHRGPDGTTCWSAQTIAVGCQALHVTPESAHERQPAVDRDGNVLVFDGRLDNRSELLERLEGSDLTRDCPDSVLVLAAWRAWGNTFLPRLCGEFALALFESRTSTLKLARDPVGLRPLYYWSSGRTFVFASEVKAILAHPEVPRQINEDLLADFVLLNRLPYDDDGATFFRDVHAVRPGQCTSLDRERATFEQFWDFDPDVQVRYGAYADYADRLRELLVQAVQRRLRTRFPIAIATSGGLDSAIVLCLADDLRRAGTVTVPLVALSYTPNDDPAVEENAFIRLLEATRGLCVHRVAPGPPGTLPELVNAAWHSEWPRFDDGWCAQGPMMTRARALGARTVLTGLWSDQLQFVTGYLADLAARFAWREVRAHLAEYGRWFVDADPSYFRSRFRRELLSHVTPRALRPPLRLLSARLQKPSRLSLLASPALVARLGRPRSGAGRPATATAHARDIYRAVRAASHRLQFEADEKLAASCGMESVTPFLDRDVIAYLMSIPGDVQNRGGVPRLLLRDAMRGIVPEPILQRRWRSEGVSSRQFARSRVEAYVASNVRPAAAHALELVGDDRRVEADSLELLGLECWSRAFFSDTLAPPQLSFEGDGESMTTPAVPRTDGDPRLPYSAPTLTVHGDLRTITAAKEGNRDEAGQPKTYTTGMP